MERENGKENFKVPLIRENKCLGCPVGVSCPGLQGMVLTFPMKASRHSQHSPGASGEGMVTKQLSQASLAKILLPPGSPAGPRAGRIVLWEGVEKLEKGSVSSGTWLLALLTAVASCPHCREQRRGQPGEKATQRWHSRQAGAKSGCFGSVITKVVVKEHFPSSWLKKGWV